MRQCVNAMYTDRSCSAAATISVLLLLAVGGSPSPPGTVAPITAAVQSGSSSSPSATVPVTAAVQECCTGPIAWKSQNCTLGNHKFHAIEAIGGGSCVDDAATAAVLLRVRKCCPPDRTYDPAVRLCRAPAVDREAVASAFRRRLLQLLLPPPPPLPDRSDLSETTTTTVQGYDYEPTAAMTVAYDYYPPECNASDVLVDVPVDEVAKLSSPGLEQSPPPSPGHCLDFAADFTASDSPPPLVARACRPREQHCRATDSRYTCVNKCCSGDGRAINGKNKCTMTDVPFLLDVYARSGADDGTPLRSADRTPLPFHQKFPKTCFRVDLKDEWVLLADGSLYLPGKNSHVPDTHYCVDQFHGNGNATKVTYCMESSYTFNDEHDTKGSWKYVLTMIGLVPSIVLLALTLLVYATLSSLRNVHGYYVMCYVASLLLAFINLLVIQWADFRDFDLLCTFFGYFTLFAFLLTFCWLNVICFDIFWMVRYTTSINRNKTISLRTILYNIYAWGYSSLFTLIGVILQHSKNKALLNYAPDIGIKSCWFSSSNYGTFIFYLIPVSTMLFANLILFVLTAIRCSKIKSELNRFKKTDAKTKRFELDKEKFAVSIKLFMVMGIPWSFEMISRIFETKGFIWDILDTINTLQGLMIFVIFVAKPKIIAKIRKKISGSYYHSESTQDHTLSQSTCNSGARKNNTSNF